MVREAMRNYVTLAAGLTDVTKQRATQAAKALVSQGEHGDSVEISVADTGHGVTRELREKLFLPYYSTKTRGTGLGLAIVSRIVEDHHGSIRVEENQPVGARFIIELPVVPEATPAASTVHHAQHSDRR